MIKMLFLNAHFKISIKPTPLKKELLELDNSMKILKEED